MALETLELPIADLQHFHKNPRHGDVGAISESLKHHGQYRAIVVNRGTHTGRPYEVLAGNHTLKAARALGWETITAHLVDVDDTQAAQIVLVDNRANDLATNDDHVLLELLEELDDLRGTGYTTDDLDDMLSKIADDQAETTYTRNINIPQYVPKMEHPPNLNQLRDTKKRDELIKQIEHADIPDEIKEMLTDAAHRHTAFNYKLIAEYYAHSPANIQRLMEMSALVIIDPQDAIKNGYLKLSRTLESLIDNDQ